jgi:uncharacterized spore protein YtfJ
VNVDDLLKGARDTIAVKRVYGEPIEREGITLIPVAAVRGGGGGGSDERHNGGGGFGVDARPVGAYVIRNGAVEWRPALDAGRLAALAAVVLAVLLWRRR